MKATIESTSKVVDCIIEQRSSHDNALLGNRVVKTRIWEGVTEAGVKFHAYIVRVGVAFDQDQSQFEKELTEQRAPSADVEAIPLRLIL